MELAKSYLDVGLYTNSGPEMLTFWQDEVGLPYRGMNELADSVRLHRLDMNGSTLEINVTTEPLPSKPRSGYRELLIAREGLSEPKQLSDPDGNTVTLVPAQMHSIGGIAVNVAVHDEAAFLGFYGRIMGLRNAGPKLYRCGDSLIRFQRTNDAVKGGRMRAKGYRYLVVQVQDVDREHTAMLSRGAKEGSPPATMGESARVSFICDPDGNWIEVSQRATLTGHLAA